MEFRGFRSVHRAILQGMHWFVDRYDAGLRLAEVLEERFLERERHDAVVIGLSPGGVPVASVVAARLDLPLGCALSQPLYLPGTDVVFGAVGEHETVVVDASAPGVEDLGDMLGTIVADAMRELNRASADLADLRNSLPDVAGQLAIVVGDGLQEPMQAVAVSHALWSAGVSSLVLALPVADHRGLGRLAAGFTTLVTVLVSGGNVTRGTWYQDAREVTREELVTLISGIAATRGSG